MRYKNVTVDKDKNGNRSYAPTLVKEIPFRDSDLYIYPFPDDRFDWWLWSNKMLLMQSLNIPIIGMLKESGDNIFDIYPNMTSIFEEHGFVRHQEIECSKNKTFEFYDWNIFTKKIIGDHTV